MDKDLIIKRQQAIKEIKELFSMGDCYCDEYAIVGMLNTIPSVQSEQVAMIKEIRKWINSKNRGNADYFIVDKIEEIINKYE